MTFVLSLLAIFLPFLATAGYFAARQYRLNRAMDAMNDSRRQAGYVGPSLEGPY
ncbi:hypothetical protein [Deinococcus irradiatisoli]|uniref:hypothetical protein n=1 Tax=Deinococcus irradiatisoli TaxID=2202254 RepID=UPI0015E83C9F|nr:hypothetical protein [Deinococcus irradiatisoli]